jgi:RHS repeat-associated protein
VAEVTELVEVVEAWWLSLSKPQLITNNNLELKNMKALKSNLIVIAYFLAFTLYSISGNAQYSIPDPPGVSGSTELCLSSYALTSGSGSNPGSVNKENDNATSGWTAISITNGGATVNNLSAAIPLPFPFYYFGQGVTQYKVSLNGILTFSTSSTTASTGQNSALPVTTTGFPEQSILFWDYYQKRGTNDKVYYKTFTSGPNKQHWIKWYAADMGGTSATLGKTSNSFFAIVLEENTNCIYFVDMKKPTGTSALSATLGLQYDSDNYKESSSSLALTSPSANNYYTNNVYYNFTPVVNTVYETTDTITYTSSSFSSTEKLIGVNESTSLLTDSLTDANLFVLVNTGDDYTLGTSETSSTSLELTATGYDEDCKVLFSFTKDITLDFSKLEVEKLIRINLNPYETTEYNTLELIGISIAKKSDDNSPSSVATKAWIDEDYTYDVNSGDYASTAFVNINSASVIGRLVTFSWNPVHEFNNHYQLQVLRLYNLSETKNTDPEYVSNNDIDWSRALSIEVENETSVSLYMAEGTGYYAWRVRPIGNYYEGCIANSLNWGLWSSHPAVADDIDYFTSCFNRLTIASALTYSSSASLPDYVFYVEQADTDKYWIFNRAFTERNGIAQGISYATGLGQVKQNQRLLQEQDSILVNQAAYDYCGRLAIQTLTAPYAQSHLGYVETLMQDESSTLYGPDDFDTEERVKFPDDLDKVPVWENPDAMYGPINNYFSDKNPDVNIPNANGFPYAKTLYHQDGRVKKQSLYGDEHRMGLYDKTYDGGGLQRTIRTYYSAISDSECLKVFGNETPHDTNMYKIITVDPNERPFVEYKTIDGKTIATAYINTGEHALVDDIWENPVNDPTKVIRKIIEGEVMSDPNTIVREQSIAFAEPTIQINLKYWIDASDDIFEANCVDYCRTCDYSVYLYIIREETDELKWDATYTIGANICSSSKDFEKDTSLTLSDPGVYRFGRKITVNGLYNGEKHYSEYHDSIISKKMDENVLSQYDSLVAYLEGTKVDDKGNTLETDLDKLNYYLDKLAGEVTPLSSVSYLSGGSVINNATTDALPDLLNDGMKVSYNATTDEYTISNYCSEVVIPKVSCDEDVCDDYWIDYGASTTDIDNDGTADYDADVAELFKDEGGYYDFESLLFSKAETQKLVDETGTALGDKIYRYFYDQYGSQIYPTNNWYSEASIYIKDEHFHTNVSAGFDYAGHTLTINLPDPANLTSNTAIYQNEFEDNCNTNSSDRDIIYDLVYYGVNTVTELETTFICGDLDNINEGTKADDSDDITDNEELHNSGDFTNRDCPSSSSSSEYYFTGAQLANSIYYTLYNAYLTVNGFTVTKEKTSDGYYKINITVDHDASIELADLAGTLSLTMALKDADNYVKINDFELHKPTGEFLYGNGALNAMLNHMIVDAYNCIDIMLATEQFVNDWQGLFVTKGSTEMPGMNFLDYYLSIIGALESEEGETQSNGKQYTGFSDHPYGDGDYDYPYSDGSMVSDFGFGYLEYAYKSFYTDQTTNDHCFDQYGVILGSLPAGWSNPSGESLTDTNFVWDEATCGSAAWWDGSNIIADDRFESPECKVWEQLYTCLQTDIDQAVETAGLEDSDGDGDYADEMENMVLSKMTTMFSFRELALTNIIADEDETLNETEVILAKEQLMTTLKAKYLNAATHTSSDKNDRLQALLYAQKLVVGKIDLKFNPLSGSDYNILPAIKTTKGQELVNELQNKVSECLCSPTQSGIKEWINEIADEKKLDISAISSVKQVYNTSFFGSLSSLGTVAATFSFSGGKLQFNDGSTTHTVMYVYNTNGGNEIYEVPALGYKLSEQSPVSAKVSLQRFKKKDCKQDNIDYLLFILKEELEKARQDEIDSSLVNYYTECTLPDSIIDTLMIEYGVDYVHFTLFYYDINGNLVKTIPPKGVDVFDNDTDDDEVIDTVASRMDVKNHTLATEYRYNSLGQKIYESTPDGGETEFWYNKVGQIRFSRNDLQKAHQSYSYIKYDELGRPIESGESTWGVDDDSFVDNVENKNYPEKANTYRTVTVYNDAISGLSYINGEELEQEYLQNRVSYSYADADGTEDSGDEIYTYFSYSPHGMLEWMLQSIPRLNNNYIEYEYDLISGKVTQISYNAGRADQFFHKYVYDSDNRIKKVQTSRNAYLWDTDATYEYYAYGPLKRVSIGEDRVQGNDFVYTINGWLKSVNHQSLDADNDPGNDGSSTSSYAKDVFGYTLGYFEGDFKRGYDSDTSGNLDTYSPFNSEFSDVSSQYYNTGKNQLDWYRSGGAQQNNYKPLFDGTITNMVYNVNDPSAGMNHSGVPQGFMFNYDELNRLTHAAYDYSSGSSSSATWQGSSVSTSFKEYLSGYSYDENGNIDTLLRYAGISSKLAAKMDSLHYKYNLGTNQLNYLNENFSATTALTNDLEDQTKNNYQYDAIGQLVTDASEDIEDINWTPSHKVETVTYTNGKTISFTYNSLGHRTRKMVLEPSGVNSVFGQTAINYDTSITYYVSDVNGRTMAIYTATSAKENAALTELPVYATSRIGEVKSAEGIDPDEAISEEEFSRSLGNKYYEQTDHLGNVRAVVKDVKAADGTAIVASATDYYPYGSEMPGRTYSSNEYRYGYQGKEKDDELKGSGNSYDFGARLYDSRVGRWLSMDPLAAQFADMSPYNAMGNNPINLVDPDGMATYESQAMAAMESIENKIQKLESKGAERLRGTMLERGFQLPESARDKGQDIFQFISTHVDNLHKDMKGFTNNIEVLKAYLAEHGSKLSAEDIAKYQSAIKRAESYYSQISQLADRGRRLLAHASRIRRVIPGVSIAAAILLATGCADLDEGEIDRPALVELTAGAVGEIPHPVTEIAGEDLVYAFYDNYKVLSPEEAKEALISNGGLEAIERNYGGPFSSKDFYIMKEHGMFDSYDTYDEYLKDVSPNKMAHERHD